MAAEDEFKSDSKTTGADCEDDLKLSFTLLCRPTDAYKAFTDERDVSRYTMAKSSFDTKEGGDFSFFDGNVLGRFMKLEENKSIVMAWKFKEWAVGTFSTVTITLTEKGDGVTDVVLTQTGIPRADAYGHGGWKDRCEGGWRERIIGGIKRFLGYGLEWND
eukprot:Plantae.Rhodophyta-Rhodochaete_pulchella.ctg25698.p1 GENE.Plantae.Rhodophyta-Rhodochaete_pulchella.ctg25698~~Plantae.Rhodophyta-Rhodochaete_pulchella.ctg25698.p1  ORF type:complete len:161 (-),score=34.08 Plantae.Rhodophyta-Rhodochaete_pulchella.ctg25698:79-561(-)